MGPMLLRSGSSEGSLSENRQMPMSSICPYCSVYGLRIYGCTIVRLSFMSILYYQFAKINNQYSQIGSTRMGTAGDLSYGDQQTGVAGCIVVVDICSPGARLEQVVVGQLVASGGLNYLYRRAMSVQSYSNRLNQNCDSEDDLPESKPGRKPKGLPKPPQTTEHNKKKIKCELYDQGRCTKGLICNFSHSFIPDVAKKFCKRFLVGSCSRDEQCPFSHNTGRYPCRSLHVQGSCENSECPYSHAKIESDCCSEYFHENADYLIKLHQEEAELSQKSLDFISKHDLLAHGSSPKQQDSTTRFEFPFYLGMGLRALPSKDSTPPEPSNCLKRTMTKKQTVNEKPFSIRLSAKNRTPIPQRIFFPAPKRMESEDQGSLQNELLHDDPLISDKISQCIELTPEEKWDQL